MSMLVHLKRWKAGIEVGKMKIYKTRSKDVSILVRLKRWKDGIDLGKRNINKTRSKDVSMLVRLKRWKAGVDALHGGKYCQEKHGVGARKVRLQRWKRSVNCFGPEYSSDNAGDGPKQAYELAEVLSAQQIATVLGNAGVCRHSGQDLEQCVKERA